MHVRDFDVRPCSRNEIKEFIEKNHYSASINGCISDYCFALFDGNRMIGASFFGRMAMAGQWKRFADDERKVIELRRLCCIDDTPKNTESYFIARMLKWIKDNTKHEIVVSYADEEYGHHGTIYKASNFEYLGKSAGAKVIYFNGKKYHDKSIRTKNNGKLKPFAIRLREALDNGQARYSKTAGKHTYVYRIKRKRVSIRKPEQLFMFPEMLGLSQ